ncbi:MAG TPA: glycosyltransferase family 2 protein [bacterium]
MKKDNRPFISVIVPVFYNAGTLRTLLSRLDKVADGFPKAIFEFIFVEDGSGDDSYKVLSEMAEKDKRVRIVKLSRNFGSFSAILAGLCCARGECAVTISADLQDPPELIPELVEKWLTGSKVVLAIRRKREEPWFIKLPARLYYTLIRAFAIADMPIGGFDFVLLDRAVIEVIKKMDEKNTSLMGLILWTGFNRSVIHYDRQKRPADRSRWTFTKKMKYFIDSFVAFSYFPIRFCSALGLIIALFGLAGICFVVIRKMLYGYAIVGWASLMTIVLLLGGVQLVILGVIGEYIWRTLDASRNRPQFIIDEIIERDNGPRS